MAEEAPISKVQLSVIEKSLDKWFNKLGLDIEFTKHFLDRINDTRNGKQITISELINIYKSLYEKHGVKLSKTADEIEELVKSLSTDINIPLYIQYDRKKHMIELTAKTIMRKKNFQSSNKVLAVESFKTYLAKQELMTEMVNPVMMKDKRVLDLIDLCAKHPEDKEHIRQSIIDLYMEYQPLLASCRTKFSNMVKVGIQGFHGFKFISDTKSLNSVIDKTMSRGKSFASINDLVRGAVLTPTKKEASAFVQKFLEANHHMIAGYEEKKPEMDPVFGYYGSHHLDLNINGVIVELQVMSRKMWDYKEQGHVIYTATRSKPGGPDKFDAFRSRRLFKIANIGESVALDIIGEDGTPVTLYFSEEEMEFMDGNWIDETLTESVSDYEIEHGYNQISEELRYIIETL